MKRERDFVAYCSLCRRSWWDGEDPECGHLFWDVDLCWIGPGGDPHDWPDAVKPSFWRILDRIGVPMASTLRGLFERRVFKLSVVSATGGLAPEHIFTDDYDLGPALSAMQDDPDVVALVTGAQWLASMSQRPTRRATAATIEWIDEWLRT